MTNKRTEQSLPKTDRPVAVVVGVQHVTALNTVRSLAEMEVPVVGLTSQPQSPLAKTNKCKMVKCPDVTGASLIKTLVVLGQSLEEKAVLFPCSDDQVAAISEKRELLAPYYHFNLPSKEIVRTFLYKTNFANYARVNGYSIPNTAVIDRSTNLKACLSQFSFPCLLKPDTRTAKWNQRNHIHKVLRIQNEDELLKTVARTLQLVDRLVIQEWIEGEDSNLYFCLMYFDQNSEPRATFVGRKIRQWLPETGSAACAEKEFNSTVLEESIRLFKAVQYKGLGSVEFKLDSRDGKFKITEPTVGRPFVPSYLAVANGINIHYVAYCDLIGKSITLLDRPSMNGSVRWVNEWAEYQSKRSYLKQGKLTPKDWARSIRGPMSFGLFSLSDPLPFILTLKQVSYKEMVKFLLFFIRLIFNARKTRSHSTPLAGSRISA